MTDKITPTPELITVAEAIYEAMHPGWAWSDLIIVAGKDQHHRDELDQLYVIARAALSAIKEPTDRMISNAMTKRRDDLDPTREELIEFHCAMISHILGETT